MKRALFLLGLVTSLVALKAQPSIDSGWIPFKMVKKAIIIPALIGSDTAQMVLDTGGLFSISTQTQEKFGFNQTNKVTVSDIQGAETDFVKVSVGRLKIGDLVIEEQEALVIQDESAYPEKCFKTNGMIGRDIFDDFILQFDYQKGLFRMTKNRSQLNLNPEYRTKMKISKRGLPEFLVEINGEKKWIEFDSGSGDLFSFSAQGAQAHNLQNEEKRFEFEGVFSFGVSSSEPISSSRYRVLLNDLKIGNLDFQKILTDFSKPRAPRVGASILYYGIVTLDYKKRNLYYEPYKKQQAPVASKTFGFDIANIDDQYVIKWILKGSNAEWYGLKYGQKILKVNGKHPDSWVDKCESYVNGYEFFDSDKIEIEVLNPNGDTLTVRMEKEPLE